MPKYRREHRTSSGLAARYQRQGSAAPAIKPARDVDVKRRIDPGIAEKSHKKPVAEIELNPSSEARQDDLAAIITAPKSPSNTHTLDDKAHRDPAGRRTEPGQRIGERRHRADIAELCGNRLQRHDSDQRCPE